MTEPTIVVENIVTVTFPYPVTIRKVITEYKDRFLQDYLPLVKIAYTFSNLFSTV